MLISPLGSEGQGDVLLVPLQQRLLPTPTPDAGTPQTVEEGHYYYHHPPHELISPCSSSSSSSGSRSDYGGDDDGEEEEDGGVDLPPEYTGEDDDEFREGDVALEDSYSDESGSGSEGDEEERKEPHHGYHMERGPSNRSLRRDNSGRSWQSSGSSSSSHPRR